MVILFVSASSSSARGSCSNCERFWKSTWKKRAESWTQSVITDQLAARVEVRYGALLSEPDTCWRVAEMR